jgi:dTMP kinase
MSTDKGRPHSRAPFIVIEGLDRSGKTTQAALLHSKLQSLNIPTKLLKFPGKHQGKQLKIKYAELSLPFR